MPTATTYTLKDLQDADQQYRNARTAMDGFAVQRQTIVAALSAAGMSEPEMAEAIGVNRSRIGQMVRSARAAAESK